MGKQSNELFGFMAIAVFGMLAAAGVIYALGSAEVMAWLQAVNPWIAAHMQYLQWGVGAIAAISIIAIPPLLMFRDVDDGGNRLEGVGGFATSFLTSGLGVLFLIGLALMAWGFA